MSDDEATRLHNEIIGWEAGARFVRDERADAVARADAAEAECAVLWDALVDARDVIETVLAKVSKAEQGIAWRAAAAAVNAAARRD